MDTLEQTIADIRGRNIALSIRDEKIVASLPLMAHEKEILKENRERAIAIITAAPEATPAPETPPAACDCAHHRDGYEAGIRDTLEQMKRPAVEAKPMPAPAPTTPDEEIEKLSKWLLGKGEYYAPVPETGWEPEVIEKLRAELVPGDRIQPLFAYSCIIIGASGSEREFKRVPHKKR